MHAAVPGVLSSKYALYPLLPERQSQGRGGVGWRSVHQIQCSRAPARGTRPGRRRGCRTRSRPPGTGWRWRSTASWRQGDPPSPAADREISTRERRHLLPYATLHDVIGVSMGWLAGHSSAGPVGRNRSRFCMASHQAMLVHLVTGSCQTVSSVTDVAALKAANKWKKQKSIVLESRSGRSPAGLRESSPGRRR